MGVLSTSFSGNLGKIAKFSTTPANSSIKVPSDATIPTVMGYKVKGEPTAIFDFIKAKS